MGAKKVQDARRGRKTPLEMPSIGPAANSVTEREPLVWRRGGADRQPMELAGERREIRAWWRIVFDGDVNPASPCGEIVEHAGMVGERSEVRRDDQDPINQVSPRVTQAA